MFPSLVEQRFPLAYDYRTCVIITTVILTNQYCSRPFRKGNLEENLSTFLDALARRIIIYDGAMGTNIQRYQLTAEDYGGQATEGCNEYLVLTKPTVIEEIQAGF